MRYDDSMSVRAARAKYFADNGFDDDGGYDERWIRFKVGPLPVAIPNTEARKRAVPLHDLHHIATGYDTDLRGEAEISAWELAAGCGRYGAAWAYDGMTLLVGIALAPRRTWRAWRRGRASRSLYVVEADGASWLEMTVGDLRRELGLARPAGAGHHG